VKVRTIDTVQINLRIPGNIASELDGLAEREHLARLDLVRQLLLDGLARRKRDLALRLYREGQVSKSQAAEVAGVSLWEISDWIERVEIPSGYMLAEAMEELKQLMAEASVHQRPE
jgi:predicted HTH domain antitoxin